MSSRAKLVSDAVAQALAHRVPAPFATAIRSTERLAFGIPALDAVCHGGVPVGAITELVGAECSGRTTAATKLLGGLTAAGSTCAWVDTSDVLDPELAAANAMVLTRLLWVRCGAGEHETARQQAPARAQSAAHPQHAAAARTTTGGGSPHPRTEGRGMPDAIQSMLAQQYTPEYPKACVRKQIGTPGAANRKLTRSAVDREEQVPTDRQPSRRFQKAVAPARVAVWHEVSAERAAAQTNEVERHNASPDRGPWKAMDQALRATDLLLQNGGFRAVVLDFGSIPAETVWRIPMATWFRYRAACEQSQTSLLLLTQHACARSSAGLVVRLGEAAMQTQGPVMVGMQFQAESERSRFQGASAPSRADARKPPQAAGRGVWQGQAVWA